MWAAFLCHAASRDAMFCDVMQNLTIVMLNEVKHL